MLQLSRFTAAALVMLAAPLVLAHPTTEWNDPTQLDVKTAKPSVPRDKKEAPRTAERAKPGKSKSTAESARATASR